MTIRMLDWGAVFADVTNSSCAAAIVDVSADRYQNSNADNTREYADQRKAEILSGSYPHKNLPYDHAFEARDAENVPIEYIRVQGSPEDLATFTLTHFRMVQTSSDSNCVKGLLLQQGTQGLLGIDTSGCNQDYFDTLLVTKYNTFNPPNIVYASGPPRQKLQINYDDNDFAVGSGYFSVIGLKDGLPQVKVVVERPESASFSFKFYDYGEPTIITPYAKEQTDVPSSTTSDPEVTPDTTLSSTSTPITITTENSLIPSTTENNLSSTTTVISPTTTEGVGGQASVAAQISNLCASLSGVDINEDPINWTDATRFLITVQNPCLEAIREARSQGVEVASFMGLTATETTTGEVVKISGEQIPDSRFFFYGRLPSGNWKVTLTHSVKSAISAISNERVVPQVSAQFEFSADVAIDATNPWELCTSDDVLWDGNEMQITCEYSQATASYINTEKNYLTYEISRRFPQELPNFPSGWVPVRIKMNTDNYLQSFLTILCSTDCEQDFRSMDVEIESSGTRKALTVGELVCPDPSLTEAGILFLRKVNANYYLRTTPNTNTIIDLSIPSQKTSVVEIPDGVTHVAVLQQSMQATEECLLLMNLPGMFATLVPIPEIVNTELELPEPIANALPATVGGLEFSRTNIQGAPVIVNEDQTHIGVSPSDVAPFAYAADTDVVSVEVRIGSGSWVKLNESLLTSLPIDAQSPDIQVKYTFDDGSDATITKPIVSPEKSREANNNSASPWSPIILVIAGLLVIFAGLMYVRRRQLTKA